MKAAMQPILSLARVPNMGKLCRAACMSAGELFPTHKDMHIYDSSNGLSSPVAKKKSTSSSTSTTHITTSSATSTRSSSTRSTSNPNNGVWLSTRGKKKNDVKKTKQSKTSIKVQVGVLVQKG